MTELTSWAWVVSAGGAGVEPGEVCPRGIVTPDWAVRRTVVLYYPIELLTTAPGALCDWASDWQERERLRHRCGVKVTGWKWVGTQKNGIWKLASVTDDLAADEVETVRGTADPTTALLGLLWPGVQFELREQEFPKYFYDDPPKHLMGTLT